MDERITSMKNFIDTIGNRTHDLPARRAVPQPKAPPRAPKVLCMLLDQQAGYTKYPCSMCEWGSSARSQHWEQKHWTPRTSLEPESKNILRKSLVDPNKILVPPLHIKLGIM
jgi:hypothetical protein